MKTCQVLGCEEIPKEYAGSVKAILCRDHYNELWALRHAYSEWLREKGLRDDNFH